MSLLIRRAANRKRVRAALRGFWAGREADIHFGYWYAGVIGTQEERVWVKNMDSFTDKIAQKFTAQDMIKANEAAEEKELERLRMQVAEYDLRLQEIRKLNLKNLELADNLQAMIDAENARIKNAPDAEGLQESVRGEGEPQVPDAGMEQLEELSQKLATQTKQITMAKLETMERLDALENRLNLRPALDGIAAKLETQSLSAELLEKFDYGERLDEITVRLRQQPTLDEIAARLEQQPTADEIAAKLDYRAAIEEVAQKVESRPTLDEIAERLSVDNAPEGFEAKLNAAKEELTDHVHKENVKVYRNVQAAVVDENKKLAEAAAASLAEYKEQLVRTEKKVSGLKVLAILTLIASLANIGIWAAWIFDVLPKF